MGRGESEPVQINTMWGKVCVGKGDKISTIDKMSACVGREKRVLIRCVCVLEGKTKCLHSIFLHTYLCGNRLSASNKFNYCEGGETSSR